MHTHKNKICFFVQFKPKCSNRNENLFILIWFSSCSDIFIVWNLELTQNIENKYELASILRFRIWEGKKLGPQKSQHYIFVSVWAERVDGDVSSQLPPCETVWLGSDNTCEWLMRVTDEQCRKSNHTLCPTKVNKVRITKLMYETHFGRFDRLLCANFWKGCAVPRGEFDSLRLSPWGPSLRTCHCVKPCSV